jgi:SAM-dependent methyltransferase
MKNLFTFPTTESTFYKLSDNVSESSEYGGNTLNNIARGKLWATCYIQFMNFLRILKNIKNSDIILDVGCGQAELLTVIRSNFSIANYVGIELNPWNIKKCKRFFHQHKREVLLQHDVTLGLPITDNSIDLVTCNFLLEHLPKEKSFFVFKELIRVCKPKGLILITMPFRKKGEPNGEPKHVYEWTREDIDTQISLNNNVRLIDTYLANVRINDILKSPYASIYKGLKGKIHPVFIRLALAPLVKTGRDIFLKIKKDN